VASRWEIRCTQRSFSEKAINQCINIAKKQKKRLKVKKRMAEKVLEIKNFAFYFIWLFLGIALIIMHGIVCEPVYCVQDSSVICRPFECLAITGVGAFIVLVSCFLIFGGIFELNGVRRNK